MTRPLDDLLRDLDEWLDLVVRDRNDQYETLADEFYRKTGMMAPGKSEPMDFCGAYTREERLEKWDKFCAAKSAERISLLRECRAALATAREDGAREREALTAERDRLLDVLLLAYSALFAARCQYEDEDGSWEEDRATVTAFVRELVDAPDAGGEGTQ